MQEQQNLMGGALTGTFKESFASSVVLCTRKRSQPFSVYGCMQYGFCLPFYESYLIKFCIHFTILVL